jgi:hypothetical protein
MAKLKFGQKVAAIGGAVLLISMFLDWYGVVGGNEGGNAFDHPGFAGGIADVFLVAASVVAVGGAVLAATSRALGIPVALSAITTFLGALAVVMVAGRMILQPGPNEFITLQIWIFVALAAAGAIAYGGWISMRDEGTSFDQATDQLRDAVGGSQSGGPGPTRNGQSKPPGQS